jgi:hypothetical protein
MRCNHHAFICPHASLSYHWLSRGSYISSWSAMKLSTKNSHFDPSSSMSICACILYGTCRLGPHPTFSRMPKVAHKNKPCMYHICKHILVPVFATWWAFWKSDIRTIFRASIFNSCDCNYLFRTTWLKWPYKVLSTSNNNWLPDLPQRPPPFAGVPYSSTFLSLLLNMKLVAHEDELDQADPYK